MWDVGSPSLEPCGARVGCSVEGPENVGWAIPPPQGFARLLTRGDAIG